MGRFDELCAPYASVVDIDRDALPAPEVVARWDGASPPRCVTMPHAGLQSNLRQLLHVGYKIAAEMGELFTAPGTALQRDCRQRDPAIYIERHIRPLFLGGRRYSRRPTTWRRGRAVLAGSIGLW